MHHRLNGARNFLTPRTAVKLGVASVVCGGAAAHVRDRLPQLRWNSTAVEAVSGAAGEVAQIALLYPLDTVKVRCQAAGLGSRQVVAQLWAASRGSWAAFLAACYAGAVPAAVLSILVGATHYCCFCATRRALVRLTAGSSSSSSASSSQQHEGQHVVVSHGAAGTHFALVDDSLCDPEQLPPAATVSSSIRAASANEQLQQQSSQHQRAAAVSTGGDAPMSQQVGEGSLVVNVVAAVITAAVTALVESPLELFRHNSQAGHVAGNFLPAMFKVLRKQGPRSLYYGLLPYCFESWPYDTSELLVVGAAKDLRHHPGVQGVAPAAYDLAVGGCAGAVAVLVSQPCDVIKTFIQCSSSSSASANLGVAGSAAAFWSTGKALVRRGGGLQVLFVGLVPRLCHQVPGAMVCWGVIESTHRRLSEVCLEQADRQATVAARAVTVSS